MQTKTDATQKLLEAAVRNLTAALKDIAGAADNGQPYTAAELNGGSFQDVITQGETAVEVLDYNAGFSTWKRTQPG